jgi:hypothetical protein
VDAELAGCIRMRYARRLDQSVFKKWVRIRRTVSEVRVASDGGFHVLEESPKVSCPYFAGIERRWNLFQ